LKSKEKSLKGAGMKKQILITLTCCILMLFSGCPDFFSPDYNLEYNKNNPPAQQAPQGTGFFSLTVDISNEARTILPVIPALSSFQKVDLIFSPTEGGSNIPVPRNGDTAGQPVNLPEGTYNLLVNAYVNFSDTQEAFSGRYESSPGVSGTIIISNGGTTTGNILLKPSITTGTGNFSWSVGGASGVNVTGYSIGITPLSSGGSAEQTANSANGTVTLNSGYYRVIFTLTNNTGQTAVRSEIMHIYQGLTSSFPSGPAGTHIFNVNEFFGAFTGTVSINMSSTDNVIGDTITVSTTDMANGQIQIWRRGGAIFTFPSDGVITEPGDYSVTVRRAGYNGSAFSEITINAFAGDGGAGNPYQIKNAVQLAYLATVVNAGNTDFNNKQYILNNDISLADYGENFNESKGWIPIGTDSNRFAGSFNGNNKIISNLYIDNPDTDNQGLFGYIGTGGTVEKLGLESVSIKGKNDVGGIAGENNGTITNCYVTGNVEGNNQVGGIVGTQGRTPSSNIILENCFAEVIVVGNGTVGGIIGGILGGVVKNCYAMGNVTGVQDVGGVAGHNNDGRLENCYSTNDVSGVENIGGVIGTNLKEISGCVALNNAVLAANTGVGRVVGRVSVSGITGTILSSHARRDMVVNGAPVTIGTGFDTIHGADVNVGAPTTLSNAFGLGNFEDDTIWAFNPSNVFAVGVSLPTLVGFPADSQTPTLPEVIMLP